MFSVSVSFARVVRFLDHTRDLGIDKLRRAFGNFAPRLNLASEEKLLLVVAHENRPMLGQSPLADVATSERVAC
jgi:hypothetical protein